jgi:hypothetical protein
MNFGRHGNIICAGGAIIRPIICTCGTIRFEGNQPVLNVKLDMAEWPPGQYVIGIRGDPFFGYCTIDFLD